MSYSITLDDFKKLSEIATKYFMSFTVDKSCVLSSDPGLFKVLKTELIKDMNDERKSPVLKPHVCFLGYILSKIKYGNQYIIYDNGSKCLDIIHTSPFQKFKELKTLIVFFREHDTPYDAFIEILSLLLPNILDVNQMLLSSVFDMNGNFAPMTPSVKSMIVAYFRGQGLVAPFKSYFNTHTCGDQKDVRGREFKNYTVVDATNFIHLGGQCFTIDSLAATIVIGRGQVENPMDKTQLMKFTSEETEYLAKAIVRFYKVYKDQSTHLIRQISDIIKADERITFLKSSNIQFDDIYKIYTFYLDDHYIKYKRDEDVRTLVSASSNTLLELVGFLGYIFCSDDVFNKESKSNKQISYTCIDNIVKVLAALPPDVKKILCTIKFGEKSFNEILQVSTTAVIQDVGLLYIKYYLSAYAAFRALGPYEIKGDDTKIKAWYNKDDWNSVTQLVPFLTELRKPKNITIGTSYIKYVMANKVDYNTKLSINDEYFLTGFYEKPDDAESIGRPQYKFESIALGLVKGIAFDECNSGQTFDKTFVRKNNAEYPLRYKIDGNSEVIDMLINRAWTQIESGDLLTRVIKRAHSFHDLRQQTFQAYTDFTIKMLKLHDHTISANDDNINKLVQFIVNNKTITDEIMMEEYSIVPKYVYISEPEPEPELGVVVPNFYTQTKDKNIQKNWMLTIQTITSLEYVKKQGVYAGEIRNPNNQQVITSSYKKAKLIAKLCAYDEFNSTELSLVKEAHHEQHPLVRMYSLFESYTVKYGIKLDFFMSMLFDWYYEKDDGSMQHQLVRYGPSISNISEFIDQIARLRYVDDEYNDEIEDLKQRLNFFCDMVDKYFKHEAIHVDALLHLYNYNQLPASEASGPHQCMHRILNGIAHEGSLSPDTMIYHFTELSKESVLLMELYTGLAKYNKLDCYRFFYTWNDEFFKAILFVLQDIFKYAPSVAPIVTNDVPELKPADGNDLTVQEISDHNKKLVEYRVAYDKSCYHGIYLQEYKRLAQTYAIKLYLASRHSILVGNFASCMTNMFKNINGLYPPFNGRNPYDTFDNMMGRVLDSGYDVGMFVHNVFTNNTDLDPWTADPSPVE